MDIKLDTTTSVLSIDPDILAETGQEFLIYSPTKCSYVFMSKDPSMSDKFHTRLEVHSARDFERNLFLLKKVEGKDSYYLLNVKTEKYAYISGDNSVLGVAGSPDNHANKGKFEFEFERYKDTGLYTIKCSEKLLYVSETTAGLPACNILQGKDDSTDGSEIFQLTTEKLSKAALIEYDLENFKRITTVLDELTVVHENTGNEEKTEEISYVKSFEKVDEFKFESGLKYFGKYLGGTPCQTSGGKDLAVFSQNIEGSTEPNHGTSSSNQTSTLHIAPGRKYTSTLKVERISLAVPFTIEVTTSDKKVLKGRGTWIGGSWINTANNSKAADIDASQDASQDA